MKNSHSRLILLSQFLLFNLCLHAKYSMAGFNSKETQTKQYSPNERKSNILFLIGIPSKSHRHAMEPLAQELVKRGHNVTMLTAIKSSNPSLKFHEFSTKLMDEFHNDVVSNFGDNYLLPRLQNKYFSDFPSPFLMNEITETSARLLFDGSEFKPWLESSSFDLVILENVFNKHGHAIAYKFNASVILFSPAGFWGHEEEIFGIPSESSSIPNYFLANVFTDYLTFYDRLLSTVYILYYKFITEWYFIQRLDAMSRKALDLPNIPSIVELERKASLLFINQYFSKDYARPLPPNVIQVGGLHCTELNGNLSQEMEDFIFGAGDDGFIFISFGSLVNMSAVPEFIIKIFFDTLKSFKIRFLWKWDTEPPKNLPNNVFVSKWFPQQLVLAHKKIKGFITHGGLMSAQQAVFHGVPMIVIPVLSDQPYNARIVVHHGNGIHLEFSELTTPVFTKAILKLMSDPIYAANAKRQSDLFRDRPMSPLDTAAYWTEYVLRHKNTSHLKPLAMNQTWWQRRLLDIWLFILATFTAFVLLIYIIFKLLLQCCFRSIGKFRLIKQKQK